MRISFILLFGNSLLLKCVFLYEIFITNNRLECSKPNNVCDGSVSNPFGTIMQGLRAMQSLSKGINLEKKIDILIQVNQESSKYLVLDSDLPLGETYSPFSFLEGRYIKKIKINKSTNKRIYFICSIK